MDKIDPGLTQRVRSFLQERGPWLVDIYHESDRAGVNIILTDTGFTGGRLSERRFMVTLGYKDFLMFCGVLDINHKKIGKSCATLGGHSVAKCLFEFSTQCDQVFTHTKDVHKNLYPYTAYFFSKGADRPRLEFCFMRPSHPILNEKGEQMLTLDDMPEFVEEETMAAPEDQQQAPFVTLTPEDRKQRAGKRLPSELVAWKEYDLCIRNMHMDYTQCWNLSDVLSAFRRKDMHALPVLGGLLIKAIANEGRCPELELTRVYELGAEKYGAYSWQKGVNVSLLFEAAWRHLSDHMDGYKTNSDDGNCLHLSHALWQVLAALWMQANKPEFVDVQNENA